MPSGFLSSQIVMGQSRLHNSIAVDRVSGVAVCFNVPPPRGERSTLHHLAGRTRRKHGRSAEDWMPARFEHRGGLDRLPTFEHASGYRRSAAIEVAADFGYP